MKTDPSRYVLAAEILAIILFHTVQLKKVDKKVNDEVVITPIAIPLKSLPFDENVFRLEYIMLKSLR